jgi:hypothetical protein
MKKTLALMLVLSATSIAAQANQKSKADCISLLRHLDMDSRQEERIANGAMKTQDAIDDAIAHNKQSLRENLQSEQDSLMKSDEKMIQNIDAERNELIDGCFPQS